MLLENESLDFSNINNSGPNLTEEEINEAKNRGFLCLAGVWDSSYSAGKNGVMASGYY
ncbi:hypothetical protein J15TS10_28880 [Paenibacillus woosongensis]|uniref:Uncharacterized protein n=1 Tax=Paenibacillus woosongensis TaxID=307580 RepID=A0ABQ4MT28_9BACL|nr:hypothetical protein J15TS10_28880 [Paenibacillus woosongensis]